MAIIKKDGGYNALPISYKRGNPIPLDTTAVWYSLKEAEDYAAKNSVAYVGQIITVIENNIVKHYSIEDIAGTLKELGTSSGDNPGGGSTDVDLSNYYTKAETYSRAEVDDLIEGIDVDYITEEELTDKEYVTEQALIDKQYITETQLEGKGYITQTALEAKEYTTKTDIDNIWNELILDCGSATSNTWN